MLQAPDYEFDLGSIIQEIHKFTAIWIKKNEPSAFSADKIWWNYWDSCITFESSYYTRINYIWNNPVKHGYVQNPAEYKFGSFIERMKEFVKVEKFLTKYPSDKCNVKDDF